jgi:hypothetical protein
VVHSRDAANVERLLRALETLKAIFRFQPERRLKPNASHLGSARHLNLVTKFGPLDLLGTIGQAQGYQELIPHSIELDVSETPPAKCRFTMEASAQNNFPGPGARRPGLFLAWGHAGQAT